MRMSYLSQCYLLGHRGARAEYLENSAIGFAHAQHLQVNGKQLDGIYTQLMSKTCNHGLDVSALANQKLGRDTASNCAGFGS